MNCPEADDLLLDEIGELTVNKSASLRAHVDDCAACERERAGLRRTLTDLANPLSAPDDGFVARVEGAVRLAQGAKPAVNRSRWWPGVGVAAAAALLLVPAALRLAGPRSEAPPFAGTFTARGRATVDPLRAEVLLVRDGRLAPVSGQALRSSDALAVRVTNLSGHTMHLMAFGRDAMGDVHWLYPSYRDARTNPSSVPIADGASGRVLGELVQPEAPAAGTLRLVTLVSKEPLTVKEVEARLAERPPTSAVATIFPGALTAEWTARWEVRR